MPQKLEIAQKNGTSKAGNPYTYISVSIDGTEITRQFPKPTEQKFYEVLIGEYKLVKEPNQKVQ